MNSENPITGSRVPETESHGMTERVETFLRQRQTWIVALACSVAMIRILIFAAAFPLFNSVDEQDHYEMVHKFARGYMPARALPLSEPELARRFTLHGSPEYLTSQELLRKLHMDVPIAKLPPEMREREYRNTGRHSITGPAFRILRRNRPRCIT